MAQTPSTLACLPRAALLLLCCGLLAVAAQASHRGGNSALAEAEKQREALESKPQRQRTRAAYERVLNAYRGIYQASPVSPEADAAMDAVASLLAEEGRALNNSRLLEDAVAQYQTLRDTHPVSPFRQSALLSEAEIQEGDLHDDGAAKRSFAEFLKQYPRSPLAGEARQQLKALDRRDASVSASGYQGPQPVTSRSRTGFAAGVDNAPPNGTTEAAREHARQLAELNALPFEHAEISAPTPRLAGKQSPQTLEKMDPATAAPMQITTQQGAGRQIFITGIRHWSTPVYTRVAIDLSDQVQFEAARVPNPDRIFFDLHGARLSPELIDKSVAVTDDGYLRRVRVAQYSLDSSRIVLDVSHVSEYSAFFLPNPWRLIIDIHGATNSGAAIAGATNGGATPGVGTIKQQAASSTPAVGKDGMQQTPSGRGDGAKAASAKANAAPLQEVATLGQQPNRVKATHHPTTSPIAESVSGTTRATQPNELEELAAAGPPALTTSPASATTPPLKPADPSVTPAVKRVRRHAAPPESTPNTEMTTAKLPTHLAPELPDAAVREAAPTSTGQRSLVRALGLKIGRIVIDAGHGGHDSGTLGPRGIEEKDVVLDVSLRLGKLLKQRLGADVIYTRDDDTFIPLETRTAIANKAQADLFISVHANSSSDASARGVEVYYLNFTTSPEALEVAARENAVSDQSIYQLSDLVKKITLKDKIDESHEFAANVESSLYSGLEEGNVGLKDRGVKKAPFVVLIGANMPSILAEISFLTNPEDARQLLDPAYRERIAESLYRGIEKYVSGLSGVRLAQTSGHPSGQ